MTNVVMDAGRLKVAGLPLDELLGFGAAGGYLRSDGAKWDRVSNVAWGDLSSIPAFASRWPEWGEVTDKPALYDGSDAVKLTGTQTIDGAKTFRAASGNTLISARKQLSSNQAVFDFRDADGVQRNIVGLAGTAADDFFIGRYNDAGVWQGSTMYVPNATGIADFQYTPTAGGVALALSNATVNLTGDQTVAGVKTFSSGVTLASNWLLSNINNDSALLRSNHATAAGLALRTNDNTTRGFLYSTGDGIGFLSSAAAWSFRINNAGEMTVGTVPWARLSDVPGSLSNTVNLTGNQTVAGIKTYTNNGIYNVGATYTDASSGLSGIGIANPGTGADFNALGVQTGAGSIFQLRNNGDLRFSGTLTAGTVPWARLSDAPITSPVSGDYGSVEVTTLKNGWAGYSIGGRHVLMENGSNRIGLYDDVNSKWFWQGYDGGRIDLYHDGAVRLQTTATGCSIPGDLVLSSTLGINTKTWGSGTSSAWWRATTPYGYIEFGPANASWAHIYTDRPAFYFNKDLYAGGGRVLRHVDTGFTGGNVTVSTAAPSGGADGDIWLKY